MKLDTGRVLASIAAILVVGALGGSVLSLRKAEAAAGELADARESVSEQLRVSKRLNAELAAKLARTDATIPSNVESEAQTSDALAPADEAETPELAQQTTEAIQHAEALVTDATQAGRWTEQDRDRLQELLVQVEGPERRRIEDSVGRLLTEGKLVADEGFVPL